MNSWQVIWYENNRKLKKTGFDGDSPRASGAIDYAKSVIARGIPVDEVHVVSRRKAFGPTDQMKTRQISGASWCPYCLKWREFRSFAVKLGDTTIPEEFRCPICTISINDHYVRRYNSLLVARAETKLIRVGKPITDPNKQIVRRRR